MEIINTQKQNLEIELKVLKEKCQDLWYEKIQPKILVKVPIDPALINEVVNLHARIDGIEWQLRRRHNKTLDHILNKGVEKYRKLMEKRPWEH